MDQLTRIANKCPSLVDQLTRIANKCPSLVDDLNFFTNGGSGCGDPLRRQVVLYYSNLRTSQNSVVDDDFVDVTIETVRCGVRASEMELGSIRVRC